MAGRKRRALVIGGSMSGLFAALLLRGQGWDVDVFERVDGELAGRGAGIVAQPEIGAAFKVIGIDFGENLGVNTVPRRTFDREGRLIGEIECRQTHTAWERVYRLLRAAFPPERYHRGARLTHVEQSDTVTAHFAEGEPRSADLLVGADGLRSTVRGQFLPDLGPSYAGYAAWRALVDEAAISPATHRDIYLCMAFGLPPGEQLLGYPVAGANDDLRPGHRRYNWVWYRPAEEGTRLRDLLTDLNGVTHEGSIPPPLIRPAVIEAMRGDARRLLAPQFQEVIALAAQPFLQTIYDFETPNMAFGRVAIVGDAAFVARPHVAAGVAKAAEDTMALARALAETDDVPAALKAFEARRIGIGRRIVARGRALGAYIQPERRTAEERENARRHSGPERVMREIATLDFLYEDAT